MEKLLFSSNSNTNATTVLSPPPPPSDTYLRLFPNEDFSKPSRVDTSSPPPPTTTSPNSTTSASTTSAPKMAVSPEITRYTSFVLSSSLNELLFSHTSLSGKWLLYRIGAKRSYEFRTCKRYSTYLDWILRKSLSMVRNFYRFARTVLTLLSFVLQKYLAAYYWMAHTSESISTFPPRLYISMLSRNPLYWALFPMVNRYILLCFDYNKFTIFSQYCRHI